MVLFAVIASLLLTITFLGKLSSRRHNQLGWRDSLRAVFNNGPLMIGSRFSPSALSFTVRQTIAVYYFTYNMGRPDLLGILWFRPDCHADRTGNCPARGRFGKPAIQFGSLFSIFACIGFSNPGKWCWTIFWGCLVALGAHRWPFWLGNDSIPLNTLSETRQARRRRRILFRQFFKARAIGGAGAALALGAAGYVANTSKQKPQAVKTLLVPVALMTLALVLAKFYWLDSELHGRSEAELQAQEVA